jgi:EAL domain-containing protein (putative c-di-GMP-specific phosphodiesterase class I)
VGDPRQDLNGRLTLPLARADANGMRAVAQPAPAETGLTWQEAIGAVLDDRRLVHPVFQPIVDLGRCLTCGFEALARFRSPLDAPPPAWIEAAYRLGRGEALEALMLERGLEGRAALPDNCFLTVNVSPRALTSPEVRAVLDAQESLAAIVLEVTEQAEVDDYVALERVIASVREKGGALAVDDAGAGYASLSHILTLRPEFVKLDRGLVSGIDRDEAKRAVVESLGTFAGRIDGWLVAEGIERRDEAAALQALGVPLGQGYGLGRPAPAMAALDPAVAAQLRASRPVEPGAPVVASIVEPVPSALRSEGALGVERALAETSSSHVAILDGRRRPVALLARRASSEAAPTRVEPREPVTAVARRALTRPAAHRFDPLVCCDARGRYEGLVKVERLIERLAALVEGKEEVE